MEMVVKNKALILEEENRIAALVASHVIEKPKLSWWMILIPIIFIFYFQRMDKVTKGQENCAAGYLVTRKRAIEEGALALSQNNPPSIERLCSQVKMPEAVKPLYITWVTALVDYYLPLLGAKGENFNDLLRFAYTSQDDFVKVISKLCDAEKKFNKAIASTISENTPEAIVIADEMAAQSLEIYMAYNVWDI